jgi:hypothetical protein
MLFIVSLLLVYDVILEWTGYTGMAGM